LVALVLIVRDSTKTERDDTETIDVPDSLSHFFESLVGFFMLFLGVYGLRRAYRKRHQFEGHERIDCCDIHHLTQLATTDVEEEDGFKDEEGFRDAHLHNDTESRSDKVLKDDNVQHSHSSSLDLEGKDSTSSSTQESNCLKRWMDSGRRLSVRGLAVFAGVIHGLAGPGGVLAVIPAVQLHNWILATLFLSCFCLSSTVTMGCFACFYGSCSRGVGKRTQLEFQIHLFSSSFSILVGITWLVLLGMGKLDDVFP